MKLFQEGITNHGTPRKRFLDDDENEELNEIRNFLNHVILYNQELCKVLSTQNDLYRHKELSKVHKNALNEFLEDYINGIVPAQPHVIVASMLKLQKARYVINLSLPFSIIV